MGEMLPQVEVIPGRGKGSADYRLLTTMGLADYRRAGNSEDCPTERAGSRVPGQGDGQQEGIAGNKKPPKNSSI